jgi:hypothetical protein
MRIRSSPLALSTIFALASAGCASEVGSESSDTAAEAIHGSSSSSSSSGSGSGSGSGGTACPIPYVDASSVWKDGVYDQKAADVAFSLMRLAALEAQSSGNLLAARSILAPQRYIYLPGTTCKAWGCSSPGIQFDPSDPLYPHVTNAMKAVLAIAQTDANVGTYLANGLWRGYAYTDGQLYPSIFAIPALAQFTLNQKPTTVALADPTSADNSHKATISGAAWCGTYAVTISESVDETSAYAPLAFKNVSDWRRVPSGFFGVTGGSVNGETIKNAHEPTSPFNGVDGQNPYLLVSINGTPQHWAYETFPAINCWNNPGDKCTSTMEIDPIPYAQPGAYYDANGNVVGPQTDPFALAVTSLYADSSHAGQWATRTVNGVQQWGTFSSPLNVLGTTVYMYAKSM